ncbi:MAG: RluA family pseudouridine synthase [Clostridiales bacterium]|nr:RluA family pseudouridine synthase [Clostridiales bacterium]
MGKKYEFVTERKESVAAFLSVAVPTLSRSKAHLLVKSGEVRVNGVRIRKNVSLEVGDAVSVFVPDSVAAERKIDIIYEDENIVVFDKPKHTPFDAVPQLSGMPLIAVHRLDTNTTGVIVFAKNESAADMLAAAFKERKTKKVYEAVVSPVPKPDSAVLSAFLTVNDKTAFITEKSTAESKSVVTEYTVKNRLGNVAVLSVVPHTGRMHQIRAHLAYVGCPVVGDDKYGGRKAKGIDSQLLRANSIEFNGLGGRLSYLNGKVFSVKPQFDGDFLNRLTVI